MHIPTSRKEISLKQNKLYLPPNSGYMTLVKKIRICIINHKIIKQHPASPLGNYNIIMKKSCVKASEVCHTSIYACLVHKVWNRVQQCQWTGSRSAIQLR